MGISTFMNDPALVKALRQEPDACFLCGRLMFPAARRHIVYWHGFTGNLFLHLECAKELACHLISDAVRAKMKEATA